MSSGTEWFEGLILEDIAEMKPRVEKETIRRFTLNLMDSLNLTADEAMAALKISPEMQKEIKACI